MKLTKEDAKRERANLGIDAIRIKRGMEDILREQSKVNVLRPSPRRAALREEKGESVACGNNVDKTT